MRHAIRVASTCLFLTAVLAAPPAAAQLGEFQSDGWYTWRVTPVQDSQVLCCFEWNGGRAGKPGCNLDRRGGFGINSKQSLPASDLQVYARVTAGRIEALQALSASCPVTSGTPIRDLGRAEVVDSVAQLAGLIEKGDDPADDALMAVAFHEGAYAEERLIRTGRRHDDPELRGEAWFWLAQRAGPNAERTIAAAFRDEPDKDVREEGVFALSQLPDPRSVKALIGVLEDTALDTDLRGQALFWLGQSGSEAAYEYIDAVLARK